MKAAAGAMLAAVAGGLLIVAPALLLASPGAAAAAPAAGTAVYVTNSGANTLSVIDADSDKVTATIPVGAKPWGVAVSSDGATAYVSNSGADSVSVVDMRTRKVRATVVVGVRPCDLRLSPDGRFLYVAVYTEGAVAIVDTRTDTVVGKLAVGGTDPYGMAISASGDTLYTANVDGTDNAASTVSVIDLKATRVLAVVGGFDASEGVAVSPDGSKFYAASIESSVVSELDGHTFAHTRSVTVGNGPQGVAVSPDGSFVYLADSGAGTVSVVNAPTLLVARTVQVGSTPAELAVSSDGAHLYVSNFDSGTMSDLDTSTGLVLATVAVGTNPHGIAFGREVASSSTVSRVSSIAGSLPSPTEAFSSSTAIVASAAVAVGGTLFLTFPANLFNLTLHENYAALRAWWFALPGKLRRKSKRGGTSGSGAPGASDAAAPTSGGAARVSAAAGVASTDPAAPTSAGPTSAGPTSAGPTSAGPTSAGADPAAARVGPDREASVPAHEKTWFAVVVLAGALCGALLDPRFGANTRSLESYVAIVATVLVGAALPALVTAAYHHANAGRVTYHLEALPGGLLIAAGCVLVSRLANFQPGYLYGVVAGVAFTRVLEKRQQGHVIALSTLTTLTVAIIAWFAWVPVDRIAQKPGAFAGLVMADDFLGSLFVGGLVGTVIGLLPLRFLPGWSLKEWHRGVWAGLFALASFGVVDFLLIRHHGRGGGGGSIVVTVTLFVVFAAGSIAFREYFARKRRLEKGVTLHGLREWFEDLVSPAPSAESTESAAAPSEPPAAPVDRAAAPSEPPAEHAAPTGSATPQASVLPSPRDASESVYDSGLSDPPSSDPLPPPPPPAQPPLDPLPAAPLSARPPSDPLPAAPPVASAEGPATP
jgi:YVTN family beta-propeller protein